MISNYLALTLSATMELWELVLGILVFSSFSVEFGKLWNFTILKLFEVLVG